MEAEIQQCCGGTFLSIRVQPSVHDANARSRGLCGTADNIHKNDFVSRDGSRTFTSEAQFIEHWRYVSYR